MAGGKKFTKGDPRINRKGRIKGGVQIPDLLRRIGERKIPKELHARLFPPNDSGDNIKRNLTRLEALMEVIYGLALDGEPWAVQFIADRTEGKVKDILQFEPDDALVSKARKLLAIAT